MVARKLGYIHLYVVQIKPKNYIKAQRISKTLTTFGKKIKFEKKVKHLKGINQSSKGKGNDGKNIY
jgi:hypothetical protein